MTQPLDLPSILELEQIDDRFFRGVTRMTQMVRVFGGQVAAQALVAAGRTVDADRAVHSLHAYFLRPGDPATPILYEVDPIRDGRSFTTRRVVAHQHGEAIFTLSASFAVPEEGLSHQVAQLDSPAPADVTDMATLMEDASERIKARYQHLAQTFPLELRFVDGLPSVEGRGEDPSSRQRVWIRSTTTLGDDPLLHVCSLAYASDMFLLGSTLAPHKIDMREVSAASLDHAMWFHAPFRVDEWLLYDQEGSWTGSGRGLAQGRIFNEAGLHVATVIQEGLVRKLRA